MNATVGPSGMDSAEYLKLAQVEDEMWYFRALHGYIDRALSAALGESSVAILDAGCGTGGLIGRLGRRHPTWRWTGIDLSELACDFARRRLVGKPQSQPPGHSAPSAVEIHHGSVEALPFAADSFDAIVSADVLYHVDDDGAALREFARVLRPGGVVILNVPAYQWLWSYHDVAVHSRRRYNRPDMLARLATANLMPRQVTYWNTLPFPLVVARRKLLPPPKDGSDVHLFPPPVEAMFNAAMASEAAWLRVFRRLPFGTSVFAVAVKP